MLPELTMLICNFYYRPGRQLYQSTSSQVYYSCFSELIYTFPSSVFIRAKKTLNSSGCRCPKTRLVSHSNTMWNKKPIRCHLVLYLFLLYKLFNMFRATLCPSSGADVLVVFFHVWCSAVAV